MEIESEDRIHETVKKKKDFLKHLSVYIAVGIFFLVMNLATFSESNEWWFFFPMIPWGLGLMIHYFTAFGLPGTKGMIEKWELEETAREMRRIRELDEKGLPSASHYHEDELELGDLRREKKSAYRDDDFV